MIIKNQAMALTKLMSLNLMPLLKNYIPCTQLQPTDPDDYNIKLIDSNGLVKIYDRPIHVSEVMLEFPKHLVCRSDAFYIGQKIPPLSENDQLQLGHKYFLLPKHFFQSVLSFVTIASFFASSPQIGKNNFFKKAAACQQPFDIQRTPSGCLRIRVSDEFISQLLEQGKVEDNVEVDTGSKICTTPQLVKDYAQLVRRRKWKPKLETIRESQRRRLSSFGLHSDTTSRSLLHQRLGLMRFASRSPKIRMKWTM